MCGTQNGVDGQLPACSRYRQTRLFTLVNRKTAGKIKMMYVLLLVGFLLLIKGADYFVEGSSSIAKLLRVPTVVIGLTVVAWEPVCRRWR